MAIRRERMRLGDLLIKQDVLTEENLKKALELQKGTGKKIGEVLICTPFTGHPVKGVFLCVILTNLRKKLLNCIAKENGLMHPMI